MDPQYQAPQYAEGQVVPFGGGQFQQTATGWTDPATGRQWDQSGNVVPTAATGWQGRTSEQAGFGAGQVWNGQAWAPAPQPASAANGWIGRTSEEAGYGPGHVWNGQAWVPAGQQQQPAQQQVQPLQQQQYQAPTGLAGQQAVANPLQDWFSTHSGKDVNYWNYNKMNRSTRDLVLGAAEAAGHDKGDVEQDIAKTMPRAIGPRRGFIAPLGAR